MAKTTKKRVASTSEDTDLSDSTSSSDSESESNKRSAKKRMKKDDRNTGKTRNEKSDAAATKVTKSTKIVLANGTNKPSKKQLKKWKLWMKSVEVEAIISHTVAPSNKKLRRYKVKLKNEPISIWMSAQMVTAKCLDMLRAYNDDIGSGKIVDAIVSHEKRRSHTIKYLVRWADKSKQESWETKEKVSNICPDLMKAYNKKMAEDDAEANAVDAILEHKLVHNVSKYLIKWKDETREETWESGKRTIALCPRILDAFTVKNPDCVPKLKEKRVIGAEYPKRPKNIKYKKKMDNLIEDFDEDVDYEVERIVDVCFKRDNTREFLVQWKGYRSDYDSWLPEDQLNCEDLIEAFMETKTRRDSAKEKPVRKPLLPKRKARKPVVRFQVDNTSKKSSSRGKRLSQKRGGKQPDKKKKKVQKRKR